MASTMDSAVEIRSPGGPEGLQVVPHAPQEPGPGEIRLRHHAIGVNFIDIYHRRGLYPLPSPAVPGVEGAGVIEALGHGVEGLAVGQRIAYAGAPGAYASTRLLPAWRALPLPPEVSFAQAAGSLLRGLTVEMLLQESYPVRADSTLLVHAAAGGLGSLLTRRAKRLGARVIGTASTPEKAEVARANGADAVVVGRDTDLVSEVATLTDGRGVDLVVDGIGGTMVARSLKCVRPFGLVASIGWVAGPVPPLRIEDLGLAALAKPSVMAYAADRTRYPEAGAAVLAGLAEGLEASPAGSYPLAEAATAQAALEAGRLTGSLILRP